MQAGSQPSVLQQLADLPFQYFSQTELKHVLFPTLLSCCRGNPVNTNILTMELSWQLIDDYIQSQVDYTRMLLELTLNFLNLICLPTQGLTYGTWFSPSIKSLYTPFVAASIEADVSELSCHSHSLKGPDVPIFVITLNGCIYPLGN